MQALIMVGINLLLSAALWGIGMLLRRPTNTVVGEIKNREIQISTYGAVKPVLYGQCKTAMELIFAKDLEKVTVTTEVGKGGGNTVTQVYYLATFAGMWGISPDPAVFGTLQLLKLYCDDKLVFNALADDEKVIKQSKWVAKKFKFYNGAQTLPDSVLEDELGAGNVPAYKNKCYGRVVDLNVINYGNRIPTMRAVVAPGTAATLGMYPIVGFTPHEDDDDDFQINKYDDAGMILTKNEQYLITGFYWDDASFKPRFTWRKVSTSSRTIIVEKTYYYPDPDCDPTEVPFYWFQSFDVDELDRIFVPSCEGYGRVVCLDSDTFTIQASGPEIQPYSVQAERLRVSRNPSYPYLYVWSTSFGTDVVFLLHRDTLANPFDSSAYGFEFSAPSIGGFCQAGCINHTDGSFFALWGKNSPITVYLSKLFPDGRRQDTDITAQLDGLTNTSYLRDAMCYDQDSDQLVIGSHYSFGDDLLWILDAGSLIQNHKISSCGPYYDNSIVDFDRGTVGGIFYMTRADDIVKIDVNSGAILETIDTSSLLDPGVSIQGAVYCSHRDSIFAMIRDSGSDMQEIMLGRITPGTVGLDDVVSDLCKRSGLTSPQINVAQLSSDVVMGYCVSQDQSARESIEPLMEAYIFDGAEIDGVLTFIKRGGAPVATIPEADLAAHRFGEDFPEPLEIEFTDEVDLPRRLEVHYPDVDRKHEPGVQHYQRQVTDSKLIKKIQTPILMDADQAKQLAHAAFRYSWTGKSCSLSLGPKYSKLMPCDVVTVQKSEGNYRVMLLEAQRNGLLTNWKGVVEAVDYTAQYIFEGDYDAGTTYSTDDVVLYNGLWYVSIQDNNLNHLPTDIAWWTPYSGDGLYQSDTEGTPAPAVDDDVFFVGPSIYYLLDLPPLLDTHDQAGVYMASGAMFSDWHGAEVFVSKDSGDTWAYLKSLASRAKTGVVTVALDDHEFVARDRHSAMTVRWDYSDDALATVTESQLLQGQGHYLAVMKTDGDTEVICARDVTTEADGTQTFESIIRGCKGTEHARTNHVAGEKVVLLDINTVVLASLDVTYLNQSYLYNGVSTDDDWEDGSQKIFTTDLNTLKPWSGVQPLGARDGSNNLTITWNRRNRIYGLNELCTGYEIPMSESSESYEIDVYDGATVVRTITGLTDETASYTAAQQTADGLTPGDPVDCMIYQISSVVGRGWPLEATV